MLSEVNTMKKSRVLRQRWARGSYFRFGWAGRLFWQDYHSPKYYHLIFAGHWLWVRHEVFYGHYLFLRKLPSGSTTHTYIKKYIYTVYGFRKYHKDTLITPTQTEKQNMAPCQNPRSAQAFSQSRLPSSSLEVTNLRLLTQLVSPARFCTSYQPSTLCLWRTHMEGHATVVFSFYCWKLLSLSEYSAISVLLLMGLLVVLGTCLLRVVLLRTLSYVSLVHAHSHFCWEYTYK